MKCCDITAIPSARTLGRCEATVFLDSISGLYSWLIKKGFLEFSTCQCIEVCAQYQFRKVCVPTAHQGEERLRLVLSLQPCLPCTVQTLEENYQKRPCWFLGFFTVCMPNEPLIFPLLSCSYFCKRMMSLHEPLLLLFEKVYLKTMGKSKKASFCGCFFSLLSDWIRF